MPFEKGHTTNLGRKDSPETRLKKSLAHKGTKPSMWGAGFTKGNEPWNKRGSISRNAYFAGLFDGEGSVMITTNDGKTKFGRPVIKGRYNKVAVSISLRSDKAQPLYEAHKFWGGSLNIRNPRKSCHSEVLNWKIWTAQAERFLRCIAPFIRIKREQIEVALAFRKLQTERKLSEGGPGSTWILDKELEYRKLLVAKLKKLNS